MELFDPVKQMDCYRATSTPAWVDVPSLHFLVVDGEGRPGEPAFEAAANELYTLSYTLKFMLADRHPFKVAPMEVCWRLERGPFTRFYWRMMILQPVVVTPALADQARQEARRKGKLTEPSMSRWLEWQEGRCVQMLHVGAYEAMNDSLYIMQDFVRLAGQTPASDTHDIYLNDSRRTQPKNLRTIMRLALISSN